MVLMENTANIKKYDAYAAYDQKDRDQGYQTGARSHRSRKQGAEEKENEAANV